MQPVLGLFWHSPFAIIVLLAVKQRAMLNLYMYFSHKPTTKLTDHFEVSIVR